MERRATLRDIALKAGVSAVTVHNALYSKGGVGKDTKKKILEIADSLDYSVNKAASSLKRRAIHIAVVFQGSSNPQSFFFRKLWDGVDRAERGLFDYHVRITRIECGDDWEGQDKILRGIAARQDVDGAVLHCWSETKLNPAIDYLYERGIPIVTLNSDAVGSKRVGCVRAPNERVGSLAAEVLSHLVADGGRILMAGGSESVENLRANRKGFAAYLRASNPKSAISRVLNLGDKDEFGKDLARALTQSQPAEGIYAVTARDTYNACQVVRGLGLSGRVKIVGSDAFEEMRPFFDDGTLAAAIWKDHPSQAERAIILLYQHLSGHPLSVEPVRLGIIMKSNLEDYL
jgi:LacI family transcriptional regulator